MVILDGNYVDEKEINPATHKFIGTFRHPIPLEALKLAGIENFPGLYNNEARKKWLEGQFDLPQYVTIK